jgi:hypothetical protein
VKPLVPENRRMISGTIGSFFASPDFNFLLKHFRKAWQYPPDVFALGVSAVALSRISLKWLC